SRCERRCRRSARTCTAGRGPVRAARSPRAGVRACSGASPRSPRAAPLDLSPGQVLLEPSQPVHEEDPVQVVRLVRKGAREQAASLDFPDPKIRIGRPHDHPGGAHDLLGHIGDREAALFLFLLPRRRKNHRVHEDDDGRGVFADREVHDRDPPIDSDLGRGEPDAGRRMARIEEVHDQGGEAGIRGNDLFVLGEQARVSPANQVPDRHRGRLAARRSGLLDCPRASKWCPGEGTVARSPVSGGSSNLLIREHLVRGSPPRPMARASLSLPDGGMPMSSIKRLFLGVATTLLTVATGFSQYDTTSRPTYSDRPSDGQRNGYSYLRETVGGVTVASRWNGRVTARRNMPIAAGDEILVSEAGRAEVGLADGNLLFVGGGTRARFSSLSDQQGENDQFSAIDLRDWSVVLAASGADQGSLPRIDTEDATVYLSAGYRVWVIWVPRVDINWTPYSYGSWYYTPIGLTWWSSDPWGWYPFHYGSWFFDVGFHHWCWAPSYVYSPAWVYWGYASNYVGWCPVGYYSYYSPWFNNYYRSWGWTGGYSRAQNLVFALSGTFKTSKVDFGGWNFVAARSFANTSDRLPIVPGSRIASTLGDQIAISGKPIVVGSRGDSVAQAIQNYVREAPARIER